MHTANGKILPVRIHVLTMTLLNVQKTICYINIVLNLIIFEFIWVFEDISNRLVNILSQKSVLNLALTNLYRRIQPRMWYEIHLKSLKSIWNHRNVSHHTHWKSEICMRVKKESPLPCPPCVHSCFSTRVYRGTFCGQILVRMF